MIKVKFLKDKTFIGEIGKRKGVFTFYAGKSYILPKDIALQLKEEGIAE